MTRQEHGQVPVFRDDDFAARMAARSIHDEPRGECRGHTQACVHRILIFEIHDALVVRQADFGFDEPGGNVRHADAGRVPFGAEAFGERAHGEFAHGVGRRSRQRDVAHDATHDEKLTARFFEGRARRLGRAENAEHVRLELAAVVVERERTESTRHAEAGVGDDDIHAAPRRAHERNRAFERAVRGHIAFADEHLARRRAEFGGQGFQSISPARKEGKVRPLSGVLAGEGLADSRRGARNENDFLVERLEVHLTDAREGDARSQRARSVTIVVWGSGRDSGWDWRRR